MSAQTLSFFSKQHGAIGFTGVQADGVTAATATLAGVTSSDSTTMTVAPNPGFPDQVVYHTLKAGNVALSVTGTNSAGGSISSTISVNITDKADPTLAIGFIATVISQVDD
jgi:hypothetical protein